MAGAIGNRFFNFVFIWALCWSTDHSARQGFWCYMVLEVCGLVSFLKDGWSVLRLRLKVFCRLLRRDLAEGGFTITGEFFCCFYQKYNILLNAVILPKNFLQQKLQTLRKFYKHWLCRCFKHILYILDWPWPDGSLTVHVMKYWRKLKWKYLLFFKS